MTSVDALVVDLDDDVVIKEMTLKKSKKCIDCGEKGAYFWVDGMMEFGRCYVHLCEEYKVVILDKDDDIKDGYFFPKRCKSFDVDEFEENCTYQQLMFDSGYVLDSDMRYITKEEAEKEKIKDKDLTIDVDTFKKHSMCDHGGDFYADPELSWLEKMAIYKAIRILTTIPGNSQKQRMIVDEVSKSLTGC